MHSGGGNVRASSGGEMDTQKKEGVRWSHVNFHGTKCTHVHAVN